jgi:hypothetical protein
MDNEMIKELLFIKALIISLIPIVQTDTSGRYYLKTPQKSKIFSNPNGGTTFIYNSCSCRFY